MNFKVERAGHNSLERGRAANEALLVAVDPVHKNHSCCWCTGSTKDGQLRIFYSGRERGDGTSDIRCLWGEGRDTDWLSKGCRKTFLFLAWARACSVPQCEGCTRAIQTLASSEPNFNNNKKAKWWGAKEAQCLLSFHSDRGETIPCICFFMCTQPAHP